MGTRRSQLALAQAREVASLLEAAGARCELVPMVTTGDTSADASASNAGVKGLFVQEIVRALQQGEIDLAVHSAKDLPSEDPEGVVVAAVPERASPYDVLVTKHGQLRRKRDLVGTSSLRRRGQFVRARPNLQVVEIRGNVDTRMRRLDEEEVDGLLLAEAGLERLGIRPAHVERLEEDEMVPAPGQGALAVQTRAEGDTRQVVEGVDDDASHAAFDTERRLVSLLGGGCALPLGAHAQLIGERVHLRGVVFRADGTNFLETYVEGPRNADVAMHAAQDLFDRGAREILADLQP
ncbi:MAG: hydroxymethylbilane synthase [Actinomycetota bacterium]